MNLEGNEITEVGAGYLAEALKNNKTINNLALSNNVFGDTGATRLANCLKGHPTLQYLDIGACEITSEGILPVCENLVGKFVHVEEDEDGLVIDGVC